jgi:outer membrane protein assembly factor BamB
VTIPRKEILVFRKFVVAIAVIVTAACSTPTAAPRAAASRPVRVRAAHPHGAPAIVALPDEPGPIVADDRGAVVLAGGHRVVALAPDGTRQWEATIDDVGVEYPAIDHDLVAVDAEREVVVLDRATGHVRWRAPIAGVGGPVTLTASTLFTATEDGDVDAFDRDGHRSWHVRLPGTISSRGSLAYDAATHTLGVVIFMRRDGWYVDLRDTRTGEETGAFDLGAGAPPSGVVAAGPGRFVVGAGDTHELAVLDLHERMITTAVRTPGAFDPATLPAVDGDIVAIVDDTATVTLVDLTAQRALWQRAVDSVALDARLELTATALVVSGLGAPLAALARADGRPLRSQPEVADGVPVGFAIGRGRLFVALRFGTPSGVEVQPAP